MPAFLCDTAIVQTTEIISLSIEISRDVALLEFCCEAESARYVRFRSPSNAHEVELRLGVHLKRERI